MLNGWLEERCINGQVALILVLWVYQILKLFIRMRSVTWLGVRDEGCVCPDSFVVSGIL
jgi:hypothetical protein